jgi:SAM-dependent methyltransferase
MEFTAAADRYDRFMGRYTRHLAPRFADAAGIGSGMRVLDVGCGPGGLTEELVRRVGAAQVAAIDPAAQFAAACAERCPGADVREGGAEALPWADATFDAALCSLVVAFMADPARGLGEMARVTRPGGVVAACMWDLAGDGMTMLSTFWSVARELSGGDGTERPPGEAGRPGTAEGDLGERLRDAGLQDVAEGALEVRAAYADFADFWEPFTFGVGPAGQYLVACPPERQAAIQAALRDRLPDGPFSLSARAWFGCGTVVA